MAGSAIVARLQLDSKDYDKKLAESKKKTSDFSKGGGASVADMMGKFKALAGAVAACKAAQEVFNATIQSSQTIGDAYTVVVSQCKGAVEEFVYAMANADFSGFNDGLKGIFKNAKDAAQAMDALGNAQISFDYLTAGYKSDFKTNMGTAKDKSKSLSDRQAAYDAALGNLDDIGEAVQTYTDKAIKAVVESAQAKGNNINESFITRENIDRVFKLDLSANGDAEKKALADRYKEFKKVSKEMREQERLATNYSQQLTIGNVPYARRGEIIEKQRAAETKAAELRARINSDDMQMAALYNAMLVKGTDEWLKGLADLVVKADNANAQYQELKTSSLEVANALGVAATEAAKLRAEAIAADNALKSEADRTRNFTPKQVQMAGVGGATTEPLATSIEPMAMVIPPEAAESVESIGEAAYSSTDAINGLGSAMSSLSGLVGEDAAAWLDWGANLMSSIAAAIPAIGALTSAKSTETAANTGAAASGAASSVASIPVVGPVLAVAAVASILAALAAIPKPQKFATGGVVGGGMMAGDNVLIRANSGEVVLTKQMAGNIGDALKSGMGGGKVEFEIRGDKLYGILNNYNKRLAYGVR